MSDKYYSYFPAARSGDLETFKELCANRITSVDRNENTTLHIAAGSGKLNIVGYILNNFPKEAKDILNETDRGGNTALHLAATRDVYNLLIQHGATVTENHIGELPQFANEFSDDDSEVADKDEDIPDLDNNHNDRTE